MDETDEVARHQGAASSRPPTFASFSDMRNADVSVEVGT